MKTTFLSFRYSLLLALFSFLVMVPSARCFAQSYPPAWSSSSSYKVGDLTQYANVTYRAITAQTAGHVQVPANPNYWELNDVRSSLTLQVGTNQQLPNLNVAWKYILNARIDGSAGLILNLISNETLNGTFVLDHPFGASISLFSSNSATITFNNTANYGTGFILDTGHLLAGITGLQIVGALRTPSSPSIGIFVNSGGNLGSLIAVTISNFDIGIDAQDNSTILAGGNSVQGFDYAAVFAQNHSLIDLFAPMTINGESVNQTSNSQFGYYATGNSTLKADSCIASNCAACFIADNAAHISAIGSSASTPMTLGTGYLANSQGSIDASNSSTNCAAGYLSEYKSFINAPNCSCKNIQDFTSKLSSLINAINQTGGVNFSPAKNTLSADGSYIAD